MMGRWIASILAPWLLLALTSCNSVSGLKTSDGAGNITGLLGYQLGATANPADFSGWTQTGSGYNHDQQVTIGGKAQDCNLAVDIAGGKITRVSLSVASGDAALQKTMIEGLRSEYGSVSGDDTQAKVEKGGRVVSIMLLMEHPLLEVAQL